MDSIKIGNVTYHPMKDGNRVLVKQPCPKGCYGEVYFMDFKSAQDRDMFIQSKIKEQEGKVDVKPKTSLSKKVGVGIAAAVCPGLGQAVNGQWGKAAGFFFGSSVAAIAGLCIAGPMGAAVAAYATNIWSIVDAVNNA